MKEVDIQQFWNSHPCGESFVGGLHTYSGEYENFFTAYDAYRYAKEAHILSCLDAIDFDGKRTLEIGLGQGADAEQLIRRGAIWSGLDLTSESVDRVRARLTLRKLPFNQLKQGSVLDIPYPDDSFDIVFSHGVLHHVPNILDAQKEIHRVLKPDGELIVMLYAKWSLNYLLAIAIIRRLGLLGAALAKHEFSGMIGQHLVNARAVGLFEYLKMRNFIHRNTDGPLNPYSKVYSAASAADDFPNFRITRAYKRFMHAPPLPAKLLPVETQLGWHLWLHMRPLPA